MQRMQRGYGGERRTAIVAGLLAAGWLLAAAPALPAEPAKAGGVIIPSFVDPDRRIERRPTARLGQIRFLTEDDFPPFHYIGPDGQLAGFNVELARAICAELELTCSIQARRWDTLLPALDSGAGDAVIASHRIDAALRRGFEVSQPVYRVPARFLARKTAEIGSAEVPALAGKSVALVGGSAHEAYLNAFFPAVRLVRHATIERALEAVRRGEADLAFGDGVSLAFWLNGSDSLNCCAFVGGPYTEPRFFGEGAGIVLRKGQGDLRAAIDQALWRISRDGRFARLYLKHFPVPFY